MPATPPPWARWPLAALTIASTGSSRRLPRTTRKTRPATSSCARISCGVGRTLAAALLHLRFVPQLLDDLCDLVLLQLLLDARLDLGQGGKLHRPDVVELDDVEAEARVDR